MEPEYKTVQGSGWTGKIILTVKLVLIHLQDNSFDKFGKTIFVVQGLSKYL